MFRTYKHTANLALCLMTLCVAIAVVTGCNRVEQPRPAAQPVPEDDNNPVVAAQAFPAQIDEQWYLVRPDGTTVGGTPLNGEPTWLFNNTFAVNNSTSFFDPEYYVYNADKPLKPLNTEPFTDITDFRTGFAYATRPGRGILVVNQHGAVVKALPENIVFVRTDCLKSVIYYTTDNKIGLLHPNGDPLIELDIDNGSRQIQFISSLIDNRIVVVYISGNVIDLEIYDSAGKHITTVKDVDHNNFIINYSDGWLGINPAEGNSYFIDTDGNKALDIPAGYYAIQRHGDLVWIGREGSRTFALVDIKSGNFVANNLTFCHLFNTPAGVNYLTSTGSGTQLEVRDHNGETLHLLKGLNNKNISGIQWIGDILLYQKDDQIKMLNPLSDKEVKCPDLTHGEPLIFGEIYSSLMLSFRINELVGRISASGVELDGFMYNGDTTPQQVLETEDTDEWRLLTWYTQYDTNGKRDFKINRITDSNLDYTAVFTANPVSRTTETVTKFNGFFNYTTEDNTYSWNPTCHLKALFKFVNTQGRNREEVVEVIKNDLKERGFVGYYDNPHALSNGSTHVYFIATGEKPVYEYATGYTNEDYKTYGFVIIISFSKLDYDKIINTDFSNYNYMN